MIKLLLLAITQILLYIVLLTTNDLSTREVIEKNRYLVTVEVEDNATDGDIYDAIVRAYIGDDTYMGDSCKVIEQFIYDVTNIKVKEK